MLYDFDKHIERRGTDCLKYDGLYQMLGRSDVKPLWVADMDFETPPFVIRTIEKRLRQRVLGYTVPTDRFYQAIISWMKRRHSVSLEPQDIHFVAGIVPGIHHALNALTEKGDKVLIQPPVYHPFAHLIEVNERTRVDNPLHIVNGRYEMDFADLEKKLPGCKMMILCNPHNPGGTVWAADVLERVAKLCHRYGVTVLSDEIHSDMAHRGHTYTPFVNCCQEAREISLAMNAPSKAFNMPGIVVSYCYSLSPSIRERYFTFLDRADVALGNIFAYDCLAACYSEEGEEWLNQMLDYVTENCKIVIDFLRQQCPRIRPMLPENSFLLFLDNSDMPFTTTTEMHDFYLNKSGLYLNEGEMFGKEGEKFMRLNVALPRAELDDVLHQLKQSYDEIVAS